MQFTKDKAVLKRLTSQYKKLNSLLLIMQQTHSFDKDDHSVLEQEIIRISQQHDQIHSRLLLKQEIYNNSVLKLEQGMRERETILNTSGDVLKEFPGLIDYFLHRQYEFKGTLDGIKQTLQEVDL